MPTYTFAVKDGRGGIEDDVGVSLPDRARAFEYACSVVCELMHGREPQTRSWRLDVVEDHHERVFEIPFASVDRTLDHLAPQLRTMMEGLCERRLAFAEAAHDAAVTVREARALAARSRSKPYVATEFGRRTIR